MNQTIRRQLAAAVGKITARLEAAEGGQAPLGDGPELAPWRAVWARTFPSWISNSMSQLGRPVTYQGSTVQLACSSWDGIATLSRVVLGRTS